MLYHLWMMADFDVSLVTKLSQQWLMHVGIWGKNTKSRMIRAFSVTYALPLSECRDTTMTICLKGMKSPKKCLKTPSRGRQIFYSRKFSYYQTADLNFTTFQCNNWQKQRVLAEYKNTDQLYKRLQSNYTIENVTAQNCTLSLLV